MWFGSGRKLLYFSMVMFLATTLLQMWVCCQSCQVGAIRIFPGNDVANVEFNQDVMHNKDLLNKYFKGRTFLVQATRMKHKWGLMIAKEKYQAAQILSTTNQQVE
uniref:Transmembrane protein n=1 Tax=Medicago truncatula TaxID=3880 RepID=I3T2T4_MEDTR|nr:unknown [Medicago truncatula]